MEQEGFVFMNRRRKAGMAAPDLSRTGIYSVREAAKLVGVSAQKVRAWVEGWPRVAASPVISNDLGWVDGRLAFSFANLMELRFIAFFTNAHVTLAEIRAIMDEVRAEIRRPHPFATNLVFKTDGAKIVAEIARRNGISDIYDLRSRNFEMQTVVYKSLNEGMVCDPKGDAQGWFPRKLLAPNVIVDARLAFGRPVTKARGIPTEAIADAASAEGSVDAAAELFEIARKWAQEAVNFEDHLRRAA
jgi:DNA-binding transcriptional MerR regulator/uncharacterized protein (DUF433 family)